MIIRRNTFEINCVIKGVEKMKVEDLIKELEKHKGKQIFVAWGMAFRDIQGVEEEEAESNIMYLIAKK
jgi:hypothetical protein